MPSKYSKPFEKPEDHEPVGGEFKSILYTDPETGEEIELVTNGEVVLQASNGAPYMGKFEKAVYLRDGKSIHSEGDTAQCKCGWTVKEATTKQASNETELLCPGCRKEVVVDGKELVLTIAEYESMQRRARAKGVGKAILNFFVDLDGDER